MIEQTVGNFKKLVIGFVASVVLVSPSYAILSQNNNFPFVLLLPSIGSSSGKYGSVGIKSVSIKLSSDKAGSKDWSKVSVTNLNYNNHNKLIRPLTGTSNFAQDKAYIGNDSSIVASGQLQFIRNDKNMYWTIGLLDDSGNCWGRNFQYGRDSFDSKVEDQFWSTANNIYYNPLFNFTGSTYEKNGHLALIITRGFSDNNNEYPFVAYITLGSRVNPNSLTSDHKQALQYTKDGHYSYAQLSKQSASYCY